MGQPITGQILTEGQVDIVNARLADTYAADGSQTYWLPGKNEIFTGQKSQVGKFFIQSENGDPGVKLRPMVVNGQRKEPKYKKLNGEMETIPIDPKEEFFGSFDAMKQLPGMNGPSTTIDSDQLIDPNAPTEP